MELNWANLNQMELVCKIYGGGGGGGGGEGDISYSGFSEKTTTGSSFNIYSIF